MNRKTKTLLYSSNIWNFANGMFGPLMAVFSEKIGGNIMDISWAWATYLVVTGLVVVVVGRASDYLNKERVMILGYAIIAMFTFGYLAVSTPLHLFVVQAGLGLGLALCNPTWLALYSKYSNKKSSGSTWGLADGEAKIMAGIAIVIGGFIVKFYSFDTLFVVMGSLQVVATIYQMKILKK